MQSRKKQGDYAITEVRKHTSKHEADEAKRIDNKGRTENDRGSGVRDE